VKTEDCNWPLSPSPRWTERRAVDGPDVHVPIFGTCPDYVQSMSCSRIFVSSCLSVTYKKRPERPDGFSFSWEIFCCFFFLGVCFSSGERGKNNTQYKKVYAFCRDVRDVDPGSLWMKFRRVLEFRVVGTSSGHSPIMSGEVVYGTKKGYQVCWGTRYASGSG